MFRWRKYIDQKEEYRLITSIEKAKEDWMRFQGWRVSEEGVMDAQIPLILAEVRYRYLLNQARKRDLLNHWYFEDKFGENGHG